MAYQTESQNIAFPTNPRNGLHETNSQSILVEGFQKKINLGNYYNQGTSNSSKISFEIISTSFKKKLSEIMFDIPYFMKEIDFFSKYENKIALVLKRDLDLPQNHKLITSVKQYVFPISKAGVVDKELDKENNMNIVNVGKKDLLSVTSNINININSEKEEGNKKKLTKKKFYYKAKQTNNLNSQKIYHNFK